MDDVLLERYARHILLDEIGVEGQIALSRACVLVVGAGGLGCPALMYLASAGVGTLLLMDDDRVCLSNLQRQILYQEANIGEFKVDAAQRNLQLSYPTAQVVTITKRFKDDPESLRYLLSADVVVDCCDNFEARYLLNRLCFQHKKALIFGAAAGFEGQASVFNFAYGGPLACYNCVFPEQQEAAMIEACASSGVFAPLTGLIGSIQASEALKILLGMLTSKLRDKLFCIDMRTFRARTLLRVRDPDCQVCCSIGHDS